MDALIGHTGFVGSSLLRTGSTFSSLFNSTNISTISDRSFDTVVCAGVSAVKWMANKAPEADWSAIQALLEPLQTIRATRFVLISTVDVYPNPAGVTEETQPNEGPEPYGRHRLRLENWVRERFENHHVIRLPGLFGPGLKKNVIFDLMNKNNLHAINTDSSFQWYPVDHLSGDIDKIVAAGLKTINIAPEPVQTGQLAEAFFPELRPHMSPRDNPVFYDMRTCHAGILGGKGLYHLEADKVLDAIGQFIRPTSHVTP